MTEVMSGQCENISTLESPRNVLEAPAWLDLAYLLDDTHYCIESEGIESAPTRGIRGGMREADDCIGGWLPADHSDMSHSPPRVLPVHGLTDLGSCDEVFRREELPTRFCGERSSSPGPLAVTVGSPNRFGVSEEEESPAVPPRLVKTVENCAAPKPSLDSRFRELLRKVTVNEDDLLRAIERLGGGEKGMKAVLGYIMYCHVLKEHNSAVFDPETFARGLEHLCILKGQALPTEESNLATSHLGNSLARSHHSTPDLESQPGVSGAPFVPLQPNFSKWHLQTQEDWYRNYHHLDACRMSYMENPPAFGAMYPSFYCAYPPAFAGYASLNPCVHPVFLPVMGSPTIPGNPATSVQGAANVRAARGSRIARHRGSSTVPPRQTIQAGQATTGRAERVPYPVLSGGGQSKPQGQPDLVLPTSAQGQRRDGLVFLLHKELKPSDVSSLGRTVLPKKEAETHLPYLAIREGISLAMEDFDTGQSWPFRYRFWPNNKSRMYLLENTRDFVKAHNLQEGDLLLLYRNAGNNYVVRGEKHAQKDEARQKDLGTSTTFGSGQEEASHGEDQRKRKKL